MIDDPNAQSQAFYMGGAIVTWLVIFFAKIVTDIYKNGFKFKWSEDHDDGMEILAHFMVSALWLVAVPVLSCVFGCILLNRKWNG